MRVICAEMSSHKQLSTVKIGILMCNESPLAGSWSKMMVNSFRYSTVKSSAKCFAQACGSMAISSLKSRRGRRAYRARIVSRCFGGEQDLFAYLESRQTRKYTKEASQVIFDLLKVLQHQVYQGAQDVQAPDKNFRDSGVRSRPTRHHPISGPVELHHDAPGWPVARYKHALVQPVGNDVPEPAAHAWNDHPKRVVGQAPLGLLQTLFRQHEECKVCHVAANRRDPAAAKVGNLWQTCDA